MSRALNFLLIGSLLQGALCGNEHFKTNMPQSVQVLSGSCVTIPCSFEISSDHEKNLDGTCKALWTTKKSKNNENEKLTSCKEMRGNLKQKDCTTTFNNMSGEYNNTYYFRLECNNALKWTFGNTLNISVKSDPPSLSLTPSTLEVKEGTSVSLMCSAPAPCWSHPPSLTWTPNLGESVETLQENQDKTKTKTSVVNFTASHLHHGKKITCTAVYKKQDGSSDASAETSLTAVISYSPKDITVSVSPSGSAAENRNVILTCSSNANPAVTNYSWHRADEKDANIIGTGPILKTEASEVSGPFFCKAENKVGFGRSSNMEVDPQYSPKNTTVSVSPSGPVKENSSVTLTCSSEADPLVRTYTWHRADGNQDMIGTGPILKTEASKVSSPFFCKAENDLGEERSTNIQLDVQYSPKNTTVSVSPSGPVPENRNVTLTCSSNANPAVRNYTWYRASERDADIIGTGPILNIEVSKVSSPFFCKAENELGVGNSTNIQLDVQFPPEILPSYACTKTTNKVNCSCESVGKPTPTLLWYLNGLPVNQSGKFEIISETLNNTVRRSFFTINQPQHRELSTLLCRSFNSVGSASQHFCVNCLHCQDQLFLVPFIATVGALLLVLVFFLLFAIRAHKNHRDPKSTLTCEMDAIATSQHLITEENEAPDVKEESIYENTSGLRQADTANPTTISESNSPNVPSSGPNNAEEASKNSVKTVGGSDSIYSSVDWKSKSKKKKGENFVNMNTARGSFLKEKCMAGATDRNVLSDATEMESLCSDLGSSNVKKEVECEYAQVSFKDKRAQQK